MAFIGGASFAIGGTIPYSSSNAYMYLSGIPYCGPYCVALSYIFSVGCGSFTTTRVNAMLRSYFEDKYKKQWLLANQGRIYVEHGVLREVPIFEVTPLPEGLAFLSWIPNPINALSRILIVTIISNVVKLVFVKSVSYAFIKLRSFLRNRKQTLT